MPYIGKSPSAGVRQRYQYTATAGQTTFTGTDLGNLTLTYTDNNFVDVFQNGVLLKGGGTDYTATSGTSVVLTTGASVSDVIEIIVYDVFSVGNFFNRTDSDSRYVNVDGDTMTGNLGIGVAPTTSYGRVAQIHDTGTSGANLRLTDSNSGSGTGNGFEIIQLGVNNYMINRETGFIEFYTSGTEAMKIDSNGHITKPKQSAFLAVSNSTQSNIATNTTTTISFNYEVFDQNADYNNSNYTFTAPVTGRYQLNAQIYMYQMPENGGYSLININTSNRAYLDIFTNSAHDSEITYNSLKIACLADMDANDTATVSFYQQQGTAQADIQGSGSNAGNTQFSGFLVA